MNTDLIKPGTLADMCSAWRQSAEDIKTAFALLVAVEERLKRVFNPNSYLFDMSRDNRAYRDYEHPDTLLAELKKDAWRVLIDRMQLRRVLSIARNKELDQQLETGKDLPDIEETQILAMLEGSANNVHLYIEEAVKEVFDWLRPHHREPYVTNQKFEQELGARVVIGWACRRNYSGHGFRIHYNRRGRRADAEERRQAMKTPHTVTITIKDNPTCEAYEVAVVFDPACPAVQDMTQAIHAAMLALDAIRKTSTAKGVDLRYSDGRHTKLDRG